jgi:hypothetical protein
MRKNNLSCSVKGIGGAGKLAARISAIASESESTVESTELSIELSSRAVILRTSCALKAGPGITAATPEDGAGIVFTGATSAFDPTEACPDLRIAGTTSATTKTPATATPQAA